ncbi:unnamed protein product [Merluccius merluccius]
MGLFPGCKKIDLGYPVSNPDLGHYIRTAPQPSRDASVIIDFLRGKFPSGVPLSRKFLSLQGSRARMQDCVTSSLILLPFSDGDE